MGAIRWDAWVGETSGYDIGEQVERSLSPERWHSRLPFFAEVLSNSEVRVHANRPVVMDQEIAYAHAAGLDYFAFVMYAADNPQTKGGIDLYLQARHKTDIGFAMILQSYTLSARDIERLVGYFTDPSYRRVAGGRPLVFLLGPSRVDDVEWSDAPRALADLRSRAAAAGLGRPYIVHLWGWPELTEVPEWLGLDAISAYSLNFDEQAAPYGMLAEKAEAKWDEWRATGKKVVPLATAGWDRRPRVEHPVSWEAAETRPDAMSYYYEAPTPAELGAHLRAALDWCARNEDAAEADTVLVYAWNEFDEGGWLAPSLWPEQGAKRLEAIGDVLRNWRRSRPMQPDIEHRPSETRSSDHPKHNSTTRASTRRP